MLEELLTPILSWLGIGLIPFLLILLIVVLVFKD